MLHSNAISRFGKKHDLYRKGTDSRNAFGQVQSSWTRVGTVFCLFTQDRRTSQQSGSGTRTTGSPNLYFYPSADVEAGDRIEVDGRFYDVDAPTELRGYVSASGSLVEDFEP